MLPLEEMLIRFFVALILGALMGLERESVGKEAGIRTAMLVSGGAALFAIISITIPHTAFPDVPADQWGTIPDRVASNIVVGIGFLGAGIILKTNGHVRGLTTAALIWAVAAVGTLAGLGLFGLAIISSISMSILLFGLRRIGIYEIIRPEPKKNLAKKPKKVRK